MYFRPRTIITERRNLSAVVLIVVLCLGIYGSTLTHSFVYDDDTVIKNSPFVRQWGNLPGLFSLDYFSLSGEQSYRPVATFSYLLDYSLWKLRPFGYHLSNLFLHTLNGVLIYFLTRSLFKRSTAALVSALLFCVHPVSTEAVNGVSFREDLLALTFGLLAFISYLKAAPEEPRQRLHFGLCPLFFLLALFSKEMAVSLPLLFLLSELCFRQASLPALRKRIPLYSALFLALGFYLLIRFVILRNPHESPFTVPPLSWRILSMTTIVFFYLKLLILPLRLSAEYIYPLARSFRQPEVIFSVTGLAAIVILSFTNFRRFPGILFGTWWFLLALLPVANIVPLYNPVAERYLYLPLVGFCLALAVAGESVFLRFRPPAKYLPVVILFVLLGFYSIRTAARNRDWKDLLTFCRKTVETCPRSARFHNNLGFALEDRGRIEEAIREYEIAAELDPDLAAAYNNLGCAYGKQGMLDEAIKIFLKGIQIAPGYAKFYNNLGMAYRKKGMLEEAAPLFRRAVELNPNYVKAHRNLGLAYEEQGRLAEAAEHFQAALRLHPDNAALHYYLGRVFNTMGDRGGARLHAEKAMALDPRFEPAAAATSDLNGSPPRDAAGR